MYRFQFDEFIAGEILQYCKTNNFDVIDLGCGNGAYVSFLRNGGIRARGYDNYRRTQKISNGTCAICDLSQPVNLSIADVVLSIEVGEHIEKQYEPIFLNNLVIHTGNTLFLSWARIGQRGTNHINCQSNEYIIDEICKRGLNNDLNFQNYLRQGAKLEYMTRIMVFKR